MTNKKFNFLKADDTQRLYHLLSLKKARAEKPLGLERIEQYREFGRAILDALEER